MSNVEIALDGAKKYETEVIKFLREMIAIQSESMKEGKRCERIKQEYEKLGFDEVFFDKLGNVIARIGNGPLKILMDGHIDCVGVGDPAAWDFDPFEGKHEDGKVWGRGAVEVSTLLGDPIPYCEEGDMVEVWLGNGKVMLGKLH